MSKKRQYEPEPEDIPSRWHTHPRYSVFFRGKKPSPCFSFTPTRITQARIETKRARAKGKSL
jgi:hypothetical protein